MANLEINETLEAKSMALKWLTEMELINNPHFNNAMILNIFRVSKYIQDSEIITDFVNKRMLVFLSLSWFGNKFHSKKIPSLVEEMLQDVLPSYSFRITYDRQLFDKALKAIKG